MADITALTQYIHYCLESKHGDTLDESKKQEMTKELLPRVHKWIVLKVMTRLAETNQEAFTSFQKMVTNGAKEHEVQEFIQKHIDNYNGFLIAILQEFQQTYAGPPAPQSKDTDRTQNTTAEPTDQSSATAQSGNTNN